MEVKVVCLYMSLRELASKRNKAAAESFVKDIIEKDRRHVFKDPEKALAIFTERAEGLIATLQEKADLAHLQIRAAQARASPSSCEQAAVYEDTAPARMIISLCDSLHSLFCRAKDARDIFALRRIAVSADKLSVRSGGLLSPGGKALAREAYSSVMESLAGTHEELGVEMPAFPLDH